MLNVFLFAADHNGLLDTHHKPLGELVMELLNCWNEEPDGPQLFWIADESENVLVTLMRDQTDPEIAHVTYSDGCRERWRCHYVTGADGYYERTELTKLD